MIFFYRNYRGNALFSRLNTFWGATECENNWEIVGDCGKLCDCFLLLMLEINMKPCPILGSQSWKFLFGSLMYCMLRVCHSMIFYFNPYCLWPQ